MKAAGLLSLDLPPGFSVPDPMGGHAEEDLFEDGETPEFHTDFLGDDSGPD
jgi:segregation and condensation protein B